MSEIQPSCQNGTPGFFNRSWTGWHHYQVIGAAETIILPGLIGIICSTGLAGNILIAFTIISLFQNPEDIYSRYLHLQSGYSRFGSYHWHALSHSPMGTRRRVRARQPSLHRRYLPGCMQPAYMQCHYDCNEFGQIARSCPAILPNLPENKIKDNSIFVYGYTTSIARQRAMRFTKMVLALASVSVVSAAPFHVIQLMNLQVSQLTLTFYVSYYISVCLSYTSSSINPFPYILPTGNVQKRLRRCTKVEVRWQNRMSASSKTSSSQVFERKVLFQEKCIIYV